MPEMDVKKNVEILKGVNSPILKGNAIYKLADIGTKEAIENIINIGLANKSPFVIESAANALAERVGSKAMEPLIEHGIKKAKNKNHLSESIAVLGQVGDERAVEPIIKYGLKHKDHSVVLLSAQRLGSLKSPKAIPDLVEYGLKNKSNEIASMSARSLGSINTRKACKALIEHGFDNDNRNVRLSVEGALGEFNGVLSKDYALDHLTHDNIYVTEECLRSLVKHKDPEVIKRLISLLNNERIDVSSNAAWALGMIRDKKALVPLMKLAGTQENKNWNNTIKNAIKRIQAGEKGA